MTASPLHRSRPDGFAIRSASADAALAMLRSAQTGRLGTVWE